MWLEKRWTAVTFWCVALVLAVLGGIVGAKWGGSEAPTFDNEDKGAVPANSASHFLYGLFGGVLLALAVVAVFAAIWLIVWARARRASGVDSQDSLDDDRLSVTDFEGMMRTDDDEPDDDEPDEATSPVGDAQGVFDRERGQA